MSVQSLHLWAGNTTEQVARKSAELDPRRVALVLAIALPFALGWLAGKSVRATWAVLSWLWAAAVVGWAASAPAPTSSSKTGGGG